MNEILKNLLKKEDAKQLSTLSLIASENLLSKRVTKMLGHCLTNKYAEGYPGARYYSGCEVADEIENYAIDLVKKIFNAKFANVQPHSGSQANQAVFYALLKPQDTILSLSLESGGHLTHGAKVSSVFQNYKIVHYYLNEESLLDYDEIEKLARLHKPNMIICGASAYARKWDWKKFREIADINNSYLLADIAHVAGLIAGGIEENPIDYAHVLTSTTHKTLRGPRGGIILSNHEAIFKSLNKAVFPGIQGGPMMNIIAAKSGAFEEILSDSFKEYSKKVVSNAQHLASVLMKKGIKLVSGGTDNHLMIVECKSFGLNSHETELLLQTAGIYISKSALVGENWKNTTGMRIGTPYLTTLGVDIEEFSEIFADCLISKNNIELTKYIKNNIPKLAKEFI